MEDQYDMNALYLYTTHWGNFGVGKIAKVNDKTIRMESGDKVLKENFKDLHKLSESEIKSFSGELVKKLSYCTSKIYESLNVVKGLRSILQTNKFACVNSEKLQEKLDILNEELEKELPQIIDIDNKKYKFVDFSERLEEVKE